MWPFIGGGRVGFCPLGWILQIDGVYHCLYYSCLALALVRHFTSLPAEGQKKHESYWPKTMHYLNYSRL